MAGQRQPIELVIAKGNVRMATEAQTDGALF